MIKHIEAREAYTRFVQLLGEVHDGGQTVIVERSGMPIVAIIPLKEYQQLVAEREARFQILDDIRRRMPDLPVEEIENDVAQAIAASRRGDADAVVAPGVTNVSGVIPDDPDDEKVLACAVEGEADLIVSGDRHLLELGEYEGIPIITARELLERLAETE